MVTELKNVVGFLRIFALSLLYDKEGKGVVDIRYRGRYHAPIFFSYKEGKPCRITDLIGLPVIIKWGNDVDSRGVGRTYIFVHYWPNIAATDELRFFLLSEKSVGAGASISFRPEAENVILDEQFLSGGGTHWQRFLFLKNQEEIAGTRVTATRNNHNYYNLTQKGGKCSCIKVA